jgi:uncharacterized protein (TIGR02996 family)
MPDEQAFLQILCENSLDDATRLVYADWLEERGDPRAHYLRREMLLAESQESEEGHAALEEEVRRSRSELDPDWIELAGKKFDLVLVSYPPPLKTAVINGICELTGCGWQEGRARSEALPAVIAQGVSLVRAEEGRATLQAAGILYPQQDEGFSRPRSLIRVASSHGFPRPASPVISWVFQLVLVSWTPRHNEGMVRVLQQITGLSLPEAVQRCESPPQVIRNYPSEQEARRDRQLFPEPDRLEIRRWPLVRWQPARERLLPRYAVDLLLEGYDPGEEDRLIRFLQELRGLEEAAVRSLVESAPTPILCGIPRALAERIRSNAPGQWGLSECGPGGWEVDIAQVDPSHGDRFDLILRSYSPGRKVGAIKFVATLDGLGLEKAKDAVESLPRTILENVEWSRIEDVRVHSSPDIVWTVRVRQ